MREKNGMSVLEEQRRRQWGGEGRVGGGKEDRVQNEPKKKWERKEKVKKIKQTGGICGKE